MLVGSEEIYLPALLMGAKGCMTATAGILPEFMVGIYKAYKEGNAFLTYKLQFAILPLIREMKSVNILQGFKEAMATRGIDMGPLKMNYPKDALVKIANLKERLTLEIRSLLDTYFPGTPIIYRSEDKIPKYSYPPVFVTSAYQKNMMTAACAACAREIDQYLLFKLPNHPLM